MAARFRQQRFRHRVAVLSWPLALILLATACTAPAPDGSPEPAADAQFGPLEEWQARIGGLPLGMTAAQRQDQAIADHRFREELIAACMAEQGFEYIPNIDTVPVIIPNPDAIPWGTREWHAEFGYGISVEPPLRDGHVYFDGTNNPNHPVMMEMSEAERTAWNEALIGVWNEYETAESTPGCSGLAFEAMFGTPDAFADLHRETDIFWNAIITGTHPQIAALDAEWSACMASTGYGQLPTPEAVPQLLQVEYDAIPRTRTVYGIWVIDDPADLAAFTEREIEMALAAYDCRTEIGYDERHTQVSIALQQEFVAQHRNELEAWEAYEEQRRASR